VHDDEQRQLPLQLDIEERGAAERDGDRQANQQGGEEGDEKQRGHSRAPADGSAARSGSPSRKRFKADWAKRTVVITMPASTAQ